MICGGSCAQATHLQSQGWWSLKTAGTHAPAPPAGRAAAGMATEGRTPQGVCVPPGPRAQAAVGPRPFLPLDTRLSGLSLALGSCSLEQSSRGGRSDFLSRKSAGGLYLARVRPEQGNYDQETQLLKLSS